MSYCTDQSIDHSTGTRSVECDNMAPTLPDLPVELLDHIIDELPGTYEGFCVRKHDLKSLRRVSRKLENKTRIRFGKDFFLAVVIGPGPGRFKNAYNVANDADFRQSVRVLDIDAFEERSEKVPGVDLTSLCASNGAFGLDLDRCMREFTSLECITLTSPRIPLLVFSTALVRYRALIRFAWFRIVADLIRLLSVHAELPLVELAIGSDDKLTFPIPIHLFYWTPTEVPVLKTLERLELSSVDTKEAFQPTNSLFLASMPNLKQLVYRGRGEDGCNHLQKPFFGIGSQPPTLVEFNFSQATITELALVSFLEQFARSLKRLTIGRVKLSAGTWHNVFDMISHRVPSLSYAFFGNLKQGQDYLRFHRIRKQRLCLWDADYVAVHTEWFSEMAGNNINDAEASALEKLSFASVAEEIENGYAWVFPDWAGGGIFVLELEAAKDGDLQPWLKLVRDEHEVW
jgi:hypothetical protein